MQGGTKTCPRCGSVNDAAAAVCTGCGHDFVAGAEDEPTPRIIADGSDAPRNGSAAARPGRILSIAILSAVVLIFGFVILVFFNVSRSIDGVRSTLPTPDVIEEEIFTAKSCTEEVGDAVESLEHPAVLALGDG